MATYLIDGLKISVSENDLEKYAPLGEPCYEKINNELKPLFDIELYFSDSGRVISKHDTTFVLPQTLFNSDGKEIFLSKDFLSLDSDWAFIYNRKLYFTSTLEEIK